MFLYIWASFVLVMLSFSLCMLLRNNAVYKIRMAIIDGMSVGARRDIEQGEDYKWRYAMFDSVSYKQMLFKFWKNLDSFYQDKSFYQ